MLHDQLQNSLDSLSDLQLCIFGLEYLNKNKNLSDKVKEEFNIELLPHIDYIIFSCKTYFQNHSIFSKNDLINLSNIFKNVFIDSEKFTSISTYFANHLIAVGQTVLAGIGNEFLSSKERLVLISYPIEIEWAKISGTTDEIRYPDDEDFEFKEILMRNKLYTKNMRFLIEFSLSIKIR